MKTSIQILKEFFSNLTMSEMKELTAVERAELATLAGIEMGYQLVPDSNPKQFEKIGV